MFPIAEKLTYYNIGYGLWNEKVISEQEDTNETEWTKTTVDGQSDYQVPARIHHINWLKINYGEGFIVARHKSEDGLIAEYGTEFETVLATWPKSDPIYRWKGSHLFVNPAPVGSEAGADRLKASLELLPADITVGGTPTAMPATQHYLLAVFATYWYHKANSETEQVAMTAKDLPDFMVNPDPISTMFPRARQAELLSAYPADDGSDY